MFDHPRKRHARGTIVARDFVTLTAPHAGVEDETEYLEKRWFSRMAVESLDSRRDLPAVNPFLPLANSKYLLPVGREENRTPTVCSIDRAKVERALAD